MGRIHKWPRTSHSYNSTRQHHSRTTCIQVEPARQTDLCDHCHKIKTSHAPSATIKRVSSIQLTHWSGLSFTSRSTLIWRKQRQQNVSIVHPKAQKCGTSSFPSEPVPSILFWRAHESHEQMKQHDSGIVIGMTASIQAAAAPRERLHAPRRPGHARKKRTLCSVIW